MRVGEYRWPQCVHRQTLTTVAFAAREPDAGDESSFAYCDEDNRDCKGTTVDRWNVADDDEDDAADAEEKDVAVDDGDIDEKEVGVFEGEDSAVADTGVVDVNDADGEGTSPSKLKVPGREDGVDDVAEVEDIDPLTTPLLRLLVLELAVEPPPSAGGGVEMVSVSPSASNCIIAH